MDIKVGDRFNARGNSFEVKHVGRKFAFIEWSDCDEDAVSFEYISELEKIEPKKKPSERIGEILAQYPNTMDLNAARFGAIKTFLDEEAGEK